MPANLQAPLRCREPRTSAPAPAPSLDPIRCEDGRVYARRTVRRCTARAYDSARDRVERWC